MALHKTTPKLRSVSCHMESQSVTHHLTKENASRFNSSQAGRYLIYVHGGTEG